MQNDMGEVICLKKLSTEGLPDRLQKFISRYPDVWQAYTKLGKECSKAGPLSDKEIELIKITIYAVKQLFTPFKTHVQYALDKGASEAEIEHAIIQLITAEGISTTMMAMKWADEVVRNAKKKGSRPPNRMRV
jgi:alkylhydroperoxidase/carboxymuconolactone decarboxylase family protein YurZ